MCIYICIIIYIYVHDCWGRMCIEFASYLLYLMQSRHQSKRCLICSAFQRFHEHWAQPQLQCVSQHHLQLGRGVIMQQMPYARAPAHNIKVKPSSRHDGLMTPSFEAVEIKKHLWNGKSSVQQSTRKSSIILKWHKILQLRTSWISPAWWFQLLSFGFLVSALIFS